MSPQAAESVGIRRKLSNLNRMRQVLQTFVRHGFSVIVDQLGVSDQNLVEKKSTVGPRIAARFGRRLRLAFEELGPTYVKLGQLLATREDMIPEAIVEELRGLTDNVQPISYQQVDQQLVACLGRSAQALFQSFEPEPLAAASIGQVHRAQTTDGMQVVVKVRRPGIEKKILDDLDLLKSLAELLEKRVAESRRYDPVGMIAEFSKSLRSELDFRTEAESIDKMRRALGRTATVPRLFEELSGKQVLTMEFLDGVRITDGEGAVLQKKLARDLVHSFGYQYLRAGFFHADPHPGNIMALPDGSIGFLDLGAVGYVNGEMLRQLLDLAAAAVLKDGPAMADALLSMAESSSHVDRALFMQEAGDVVLQIVAVPLAQTPVSELMGKLFGLTRRFDLRMKSHWFLLMRSSALLDGVLRQLDPQIDIPKLARKPVVHALMRKGLWVAVFTVFSRTLWRFLTASKKRLVLTMTIVLLLVSAGAYVYWPFATESNSSSAPVQLAQKVEIPVANQGKPKVKAIAANRPIKESHTLARINRRRTALRSRPTRRSKVVRSLARGESVELVKGLRYYWEVRTKRGETGYVRRRHLSVLR